MTRLDRCFNIGDLRAAAKKRLPKGMFEFIDEGTEDGIARAENCLAFDRLRLKTRLLVDLSSYDPATSVFGERSELPLGIAPTGVAGLAWHQGELALAKAAARSGIPFTLATGSLTPMEIVAEVGGRLWFQLFMWDEVDLSYELVARARDLDFEALVVTIDTGIGRMKYHDSRNGFSFPFRPNVRAFTDMALHPGWLARVLLRSMATTGIPRNANYPPQYQRMIAWRRDAPKPQRHTAMTWDDIARLREFWPRTLIVKSILGAEDARLAVDHGADGIVVSNHGGRSTDSAISTIEALPEVVAEVGSEATVILDSGIRRGSDIVKALALGADMVLTGRATLYGVATAGQLGAEKAISILASEFEKTMGFVGCRDVGELGPDIFAKPAISPSG